MAGATPLKLRDENKVAAPEPVKYVQLSGRHNVRGFICDRIEHDVGRINHAASSIYRAKSLLYYGTRILVDEVFWMPVNSGIIVGWELAPPPAAS